jgi:hypothetical protein
MWKVIGYDERAGAVVVQSHAPEARRAAAQAALPKVEAMFDAPVQLKFVPGPLKPAAAVGGSKIYWGGTSNLNCTVGFPALDSAGNQVFSPPAIATTRPGAAATITGTTTTRMPSILCRRSSPRAPATTARTSCSCGRRWASTPATPSSASATKRRPGLRLADGIRRLERLRPLCHHRRSDDAGLLHLDRRDVRAGLCAEILNRARFGLEGLKRV